MRKKFAHFLFGDSGDRHETPLECQDEINQLREDCTQSAFLQEQRVRDDFNARIADLEQRYLAVIKMAEAFLVYRTKVEERLNAMDQGDEVVTLRQDITTKIAEIEERLGNHTHGRKKTSQTEES